MNAGMQLGGRYRLESRLGAGGMGEVWRAVDELLDRTVAVKVMLPDVAGDPDFARRFLGEAKAMAKVNHPAVAAIHDYGNDHGVTYLVMEFIDGESLDRLLARQGRISPADTMRLIAAAADGLQAVHDLGIVHRDIKPANLLIRRDGTLKITDFGIARRPDASSLTQSGAVLGTPSYLSPEQVLGHQATALSDVYALGLTAYECLAGQKPFVGDNAYAVALQRVQEAPRTIGLELPPPVVAVIEGALAIEPPRRWQSAADLAHAARTAMGGAVTPPPAAVPSVKSSKRWVIAAAAVVVLLAGAVVAWSLRGANDTTAAAPEKTTSAPSVTVPAGFTSCGTAFCPSTPMCWAGLTEIGGQAYSPKQVACTSDHYWETFAAIAMPAAADSTDPDKLIGLPEARTACSAASMATHSRNPGTTGSWERVAWPVKGPGGGATLLHCLANSGNGETKVPAFKP